MLGQGSPEKKTQEERRFSLPEVTESTIERNFDLLISGPEIFRDLVFEQMRADNNGVLDQRLERISTALCRTADEWQSLRFCFGAAFVYRCLVDQLRESNQPVPVVSRATENTLDFEMKNYMRVLWGDLLTEADFVKSIVEMAESSCAGDFIAKQAQAVKETGYIPGGDFGQRNRPLWQKVLELTKMSGYAFGVGATAVYEHLARQAEADKLAVKLWRI